MMEKNVVLVFDANQRSALASTRSLGRQPNTVVYTADSTAEALAGCSKYSQKYLQYPDPSANTQAFVEWLLDAIQRYQITFLMPVTEISSRTLLENRQHLGACKLPFASLDQVLTLSDKSQLNKLAESLGVPVPQTLYFSGSSDVELDQVKFPCVVKPALSKVNVDNQWFTTQVHIVHNRENLRALLADTPYLRDHPFMLQQFIDGHGAGAFCYYQHGEAKAFFAHKRLREKPPTGGVSVLSASAPLDAKTKDYATRLLDAANWHGVAMVEFKVGHDGTPYLMEINTRLWGSLQLAIDAGVDFPSLLYRGEFETIPDTQAPYLEGIQLRWLLGDLDNLYLTLKDPKTSIGGKIRHVLQFLWPKFSGRRHEVNRLGDLGPFWFECKRYLGG